MVKTAVSKKTLIVNVTVAAKKLLRPAGIRLVMCSSVLVDINNFLEWHRSFVKLLI